MISTRCAQSVDDPPLFGGAVVTGSCRDWVVETPPHRGEDHEALSRALLFFVR
jgi:hypothetical protein